MQEEARLSFFSSFDLKGFLFSKKKKTKQCSNCSFHIKTEGDVHKNISRLSNLNNKILTLCTANMGAAAGATLLRLNAVRAAIGKLPPLRRNAFSGCMYQARSISAAQRGAMEMAYNIPTSCYRCVRVCACQTL